MESLTSKEFFEKLKSNNLKPAFALVGIVKKSEKENEILFAAKGNFSHWTAIPAAMIESVKVIKSFKTQEISFTLVRLSLHAPGNSEAKVIFDLLTAFVPAEMHHECSCGEEKFMYGMEHSHCGEQHHCDEGMWHKEFCSHCDRGCGDLHCHCCCGCQHHHGYGYGHQHCYIGLGFQQHHNCRYGHEKHFKYR